MLRAGFELVVVPNRRDGDEVTTNVEWMAEYLAAHGADSVAAVVTTTSCFAPRIPDRYGAQRLTWPQLIVVTSRLTR